MDNTRLILFLALSFVLLMIWQAWEQDYGSLSHVATEQQSTTAAPNQAASEEGVPQAPVSAKLQQAGTEVPVSPEVAEAVAISVTTDLLDLEISTQGGDIQSVFLRDYPVTVDEPDRKFQLLKKEPPNLFLAQSGLIAANKEQAPTHQTLFKADAEAYSLEEGKDQLVVSLVWQHDSGIQVVKRYTFTRGSYEFSLEQEVINDSSDLWSGREYRQLQRSRPPQGEGSAFIYTYTGAAIYSPEEKYQKIDFDDMDDAKTELQITGGWISMIQHYFIGAWVPPTEQQETLYTNVLKDNRYVVGMYSPSISISNGSKHSFTSKLYIGPKLQEEMSNVATGLELTVDYGWLTVLAQPIYWLMYWIYDYIFGNWGWSIIMLTFIIKAVFYKLSETSYKSMANMRRLTPKLQAMKDRYGDDKQQLNVAMMKLYKEEKVNPLSGCLPIMVQIPVFIALYWVLLESVELRQAPFIFWIEDLSIKDPYFVLPLIMGASMFIQQKLNPAPVDPMQAKVMMTLPFIFTIFFAFFPSGLVLYWVVNNILSISQQWYITRQIENAAASK